MITLKRVEHERGKGDPLTPSFTTVPILRCLRVWTRVSASWPCSKARAVDQNTMHARAIAVVEQEAAVGAPAPQGNNRQQRARLTAGWPQIPHRARAVADMAPPLLQNPGPFHASAIPLLRPMPPIIPPGSRGHSGKVQQPYSGRPAGHPAPAPSARSREPAATPLSCTGVSRARHRCAISRWKDGPPGPAARKRALGIVHPIRSRSQAASWDRERRIHLAVDGEATAPSRPRHFIPFADRAENPQVTREILEEKPPAPRLAWHLGDAIKGTPARSAHPPRPPNNLDQPRCRARSRGG